MRWAGPVVLLASVLLASSGCKSSCEPGACPSGTYCDGASCIAECFTNDDCAPSACDPAEECCTSERFCGVDGRCVSETIPPEACSGASPFPPDGWNSPPGSGPAFVVSGIAIAGAGQGTNIDGRCDAAGCIDNALAPLGENVNDQIRQFALGGELLFLIEIAGLSPRYRGFDPSVTLKIYAVRDADDPFFPANNFRVPPGHARCCEFDLVEDSVGPDRVALARLPARIDNGQISSTEPVGLRLVIPICVPPFEQIEMKRVTLSGRLSPNVDAMEDIVLSGVLNVAGLTKVSNPFCHDQPTLFCPAVDGSLLDLVRAVGAPQPDIDIDGDGRECIYDTDRDGVIDVCCDGDTDGTCPGGSAPCVANQVLPIDARPSSCTRSPRLADGFSVTFLLSAVAATLFD